MEKKCNQQFLRHWIWNNKGEWVWGDGKQSIEPYQLSALEEFPGWPRDDKATQAWQTPQIEDIALSIQVYQGCYSCKTEEWRLKGCTASKFWKSVRVPLRIQLSMYQHIYMRKLVGGK